MRFAQILAAVALLSAPTAAAGEGSMQKKIKLPARLMLSTEVLQEVFLQTGTKWACPPGALGRQVDATEFGSEATVEAVSARLAGTLPRHIRPANSRVIPTTGPGTGQFSSTRNFSWGLSQMRSTGSSR